MTREVEFGIFMPVASNGFLFCKAAPRYHPTFRMHREIAQTADAMGFDYLFWMGKWKGFGGETGFWEQTLEPITLVSAIAACTSRIRLLATINPLLFHPAVAAKMITTVHHVSDGRFGINVVTGNTLDEIEQMGVVPADYARTRYQYAETWMSLVRQLWTEPRVNGDGEIFHLKNCLSEPKPPADRLPFVASAGTSDEGLRFGAKHSELLFIGMRPALIEKARAFAAEAGRPGLKLSSNAFLVIKPTDALADQHYRGLQESVDLEALANVRGSFERDNRSTLQTRTAYLREAAPSVGFGMGNPIVGSPATVAAKLTDMIVTHGFDGIQLVFENYLDDLPLFRDEVLPLLLPIMQRAGLTTRLGG